MQKTVIRDIVKSVKARKKENFKEKALSNAKNIKAAHSRFKDYKKANPDSDKM